MKKAREHRCVFRGFFEESKLIKRPSGSSEFKKNEGPEQRHGDVFKDLKTVLLSIKKDKKGKEDDAKTHADQGMPLGIGTQAEKKGADKNQSQDFKNSCFLSEEV